MTPDDAAGVRNLSRPRVEWDERRERWDWAGSLRASVMDGVGIHTDLKGGIRVKEPLNRDISWEADPVYNHVINDVGTNFTAVVTLEGESDDQACATCSGQNVRLG